MNIPNILDLLEKKKAMNHARLLQGGAKITDMVNGLKLNREESLVLLGVVISNLIIQNYDPKERLDIVEFFDVTLSAVVIETMDGKNLTE